MVKEPEYPTAEKRTFSLKQNLQVLKSVPDFWGLVANNLVFGIFTSISSTFTSTYINSESFMNFSTFTVEALTMYQKVLMLFMFGVFGKLCDTKGSGKMIFFSQLLGGGSFLIYALVPQKHFLWGLIAIYTIGAVSAAINNTAIMAKKFEVSPAEHQGLLFGIYGFVCAFSSYIGPEIGRQLLRVLEGSLDKALLEDFLQLRLIYLITAILTLLQKAFTIIRKRRFEI